MRCGRMSLAIWSSSSLEPTTNLSWSEFRRTLASNQHWIAWIYLVENPWGVAFHLGDRLTRSTLLATSALNRVPFVSRVICSRRNVGDRRIALRSATSPSAWVSGSPPVITRWVSVASAPSSVPMSSLTGAHLPWLTASACGVSHATVWPPCPVHVQRRLHPASRMKRLGIPASRPSPCRVPPVGSPRLVSPLALSTRGNIPSGAR